MSVTASHERESLKDSKEEEDKQLYKGAFDDFDWNKNGTIPTRVIFLYPPNLQYYVLDIINNIFSPRTSSTQCGELARTQQMWRCRT